MRGTTAQQVPAEASSGVVFLLLQLNPVTNVKELRRKERTELMFVIFLIYIYLYLFLQKSKG